MYFIKYKEITKSIHKLYINWYAALTEKVETATYFKSFVRSRYYYKGLLAERETSKLLDKYNCFTKWIDTTVEDCIVIINNGYGVIGLLFSLVHKDCTIYGIEEDKDKNLLSRNITYKPDNYNIINSDEIIDSQILLKSKIYLFNPTDEQIKKYGIYNPIIIK